jgi:uncharacterized protein with FMN-binding domain
VEGEEQVTCTVTATADWQTKQMLCPIKGTKYSVYTQPFISYANQLKVSVKIHSHRQADIGMKLE